LRYSSPFLFVRSAILLARQMYSSKSGPGLKVYCLIRAECVKKEVALAKQVIPAKAGISDRKTVTIV
jgi:hypothetical protein